MSYFGGWDLQGVSIVKKKKCSYSNNWKPRALLSDRNLSLIALFIVCYEYNKEVCTLSFSSLVYQYK